MTKFPIFRFSLLHPRYWIIWIGIVFLYLLVLFPYPFLYKLGIRIGRISMLFLHRRVKIAYRNLQLCFPHMSIVERNSLLKKNFESVGMGIIETGIAWFWPDWRIKHWINISGFEHVLKARKEDKGILLIGLHFLTLELGARIFGMHTPGIGVYRPNNNALLDWLQMWGRLRSNKAMLDRRDIKGMIRALKNGDIIWYAPDHDYGLKSSVFVPLFEVPNAATTAGTYILARIAKPTIISFVPRRLSSGRGYELLIFPDVQNMPINNELATAKFMNKIVEQAILMAPDQYMWLHRRFKTRPPSELSLYM